MRIRIQKETTQNIADKLLPVACSVFALSSPSGSGSPFGMHVWIRIQNAFLDPDPHSEGGQDVHSVRGSTLNELVSGLLKKTYVYNIVIESTCTLSLHLWKVYNIVMYLWLKLNNIEFVHFSTEFTAVFCRKFILSLNNNIIFPSFYHKLCKCLKNACPSKKIIFLT